MARINSKIIQGTAFVLVAVIFIFVMGITRNCSRLHYAPVEGYSKGDTLDIALMYGPGSYYFYGDSLAGINHELAEEFSKETNIPVKFWPVSEPAEGMEKLEAGAFDILASLPLDNYIRERFPITENIFLDRLVLVQLGDSVTGETAVKSSLDLNDREVFVAKGSSAIKRMQNLSDEIGGKIKVTEIPDVSDELLSIQVANGTLPLAVVNERVAKSVAEKYPRLKFNSSISFTQFQVWVFNPKDSVEYKKFIEWFDSFRTTDQYRTILHTF